MSKDIITSMSNNVTKIAGNDLLKAVLPVVDNFLTALQANQAGTAGILAQVNALAPELLAVLPNAGQQVVKDEAGVLKTAVDEKAAELAAGNETTAGTAGNDTHAG